MRYYVTLFGIIISIIQLIAQENDRAIKINANTFNNLYKINDSLYRSEQPDSLDVEILNKLGIVSILNLRKYHNDIDFLKTKNFNFYEVEMHAYWIKNKNVIEALKIINNAPKPLLIHCKHGSDRTGLIVAMYRIIFEDWTKEKAIDELKKYGFHTIFFNIPRYIRNVDKEKIKEQVFKQ